MNFFQLTRVLGGGDSTGIVQLDIVRSTELWSDDSSFMLVECICWCGNLDRALSRTSEHCPVIFGK